MTHKIRVFLASTIWAFALTILVIATTATFGKLYINLFSVITLTLVWFYYSIMFWGAFFYKRGTDELLVSTAVINSMAIGAIITTTLVGSMLLLGKLGSMHPATITSLKQINWFGVGFIWLLLSGLTFEKRQRKNNSADTAESEKK